MMNSSDIEKVLDAWRAGNLSPILIDHLVRQIGVRCKYNMMIFQLMCAFLHHGPTLTQRALSVSDIESSQILLHSHDLHCLVFIR